MMSNMISVRLVCGPRPREATSDRLIASAERPVTIIPLTIGLSVTGKNRFRQTGYRFRKINGFNIPSKSYGVNRHTTCFTSPAFVVSQCKLVSASRLQKRRSAPSYRSMWLAKDLTFYITFVAWFI